MYIACGYTDLRRGIDGLAAMVQQEFSLDPFTNTLFLFCDRRRDRIKALYWEGNGFVLLYKRLERGSFQWPRNESEADTAAVSLAHGGFECRPAESTQACQRSGNLLKGSAFLSLFCAFFSWIWYNSKYEKHRTLQNKQHGNGHHFPCGIRRTSSAEPTCLCA